MDVKKSEKYFLLLQINDALFPIGAYSHSGGLETYIQKNLVSSVEDAWNYIERRLLYGFCYNELLAVKLAYGYACHENIEKLLELEELLTVCRIPREIREAGEKLGSRFAKTVCSLDISFETDVFQNYCAAAGKRPLQHMVVYGVFCAAAGIPYEETLAHYLYAQTSSMVTNCVKTIPLSQTDGQKLLHKCHAVFRKLLNRVEELTEEDVCLSMPGFDIRCMQHEGLYSRIYMS